MKKIEITSNQNGRLIKVLQNHLPKYKYSSFEKALRSKDVLVNSKRVKQNVEIQTGDQIIIFLDDSSQKKMFEIFYEDKYLVVFHKSQGIEVCDGELNIQNEYYKNTKKQIFPIHRIDKNTIGLVMFAKNEEIQTLMISYFKSGYVIKNYYALTSGECKNFDILNNFLTKNSQKSVVKIFDKPVSGSVNIVTKYTLIKKIDELSMLDVEIKDGKTHQIRAQLAYNKMPILGDEKYGDTMVNKKYKKHTQALQAYKITFSIPNNQKLSYLNEINLCEKVDKFLQV